MKVPRPVDVKAAPTGQMQGLTPWEDFDRRAGIDTLYSLLEAEGWTHAGYKGDGYLVCRPGKEHGISGTVGVVTGEGGVPLFYCFSSSAMPFDGEKAYGPSTVYTMLRHRGDFSAAASDLRAQGYGDAPTQTVDIAYKFRGSGR